MPYEITEARRQEYRLVSMASRLAKQQAVAGDGPTPVHSVNFPRLSPASLMPTLPANGLRALSLFSGGGGLDIGFERAGFQHVASYDILPICAETILHNRPHWKVLGGNAGDVTKVNWTPYTEIVDIIHGGPPCQPFSIAGHQRGSEDARDMWPEFVRAVIEINPAAFIGENVLGLLDPKFDTYIRQNILKPLSSYHITYFSLNAAAFGVPQSRQRVFFIGFSTEEALNNFRIPNPTHSFNSQIDGRKRRLNQLVLPGIETNNILPKTMGVREALGLPDLGYDALAPTIRSGFTGPRNSTSVVNSVASSRTWGTLGIWPNGVAPSRQAASRFVAKNGGFRLSVQDCAILQGFPEYWEIIGPVYKALGQIGNSVAPPVSYQVAKAVSEALLTGG